MPALSAALGSFHVKSSSTSLVKLLVTVTRSFSKLVDEDFTWKDPRAAERAGMPMMDYVIGGMDRSFKLKLFHVLRAADAAGLLPGITSAIRGDYPQSARDAL